jgi:hypothetical protein
MAVEISKKDLAEKIEAGWKKKELADHFGLPMMQMTKVLQQAGLQIRKFHAPKFVLNDDVAEVAQEVVEAINVVDAMEEITDLNAGNVIQGSGIVFPDEPETIVREEVVEERPQVVRTGW